MKLLNGNTMHCCTFQHRHWQLNLYPAPNYHIFHTCPDDAHKHLMLCRLLSWLNFFPLILEHICPFLVHIAQMDLILPWWGLILPRIPPPTPILYSAVTHPFLGYVHIQNIPKPTPKHHFSWPQLESGQNELQSGPFGPQLGKMFEKWAELF